MSDQSNESLPAKEEPLPEAGPDEQTSAGTSDYVSELREVLGSDAASETPRRKTGFFERVTNRLRPKKLPPARQDEPDTNIAGSEVERQTESDMPAIQAERAMTDESSLLYIETPAETKPDQSEAGDALFAASPIEDTSLNFDQLQSGEQEAGAPEPTVEETSQWKAFLATIWRPAETKSSDDALDDETLHARVERSLFFESQADNERPDSSEDALPFVFRQDEQVDDLPDEKRITSPLAMEDDEAVFSEGEGDFWGGFRKEMLDSEAQPPVDDILPDFIQDQEFDPSLNRTVSGWGEQLPEQIDFQEPISDEIVREPDLYQEEEEISEYKSQPFSEEYAEVFGEAAPQETTIEPDASVQEIRTIVMEDYDEPAEESSRGGKTSGRRLRVILGVLIGVGLVLVAGILYFPTALQWFRSLQQAPLIAVRPPTPIPMDGMPYPTGLRMTGGWFFFLQPSTIENGHWAPVTSEWLDGSELRRVVALPWTRQLEAVVQSLVDGDTIELHMSNGDVLSFLVEETAQVDREDVSIFSSNTPSLALVLFKEGDDRRWVVIANQQE